MSTVKICLRALGDLDEYPYEEIDLDRLSPRARALAEAIASRPLRTVGGIVVEHHGERLVWSGWARYPADSAMDPYDYLEGQAERFPLDATIVGPRERPVPSREAQDEEWIARQCADAWGVKPATWRSYVARRQAPQPSRHVGSTPVWDAAMVKSWPRPGQGARSDLPRPPGQS